MYSSIRNSSTRNSSNRFALCVCLAWFVACAAGAAGTDELRDRFPISSIDSNEKADAALAATSGSKQRAEKEYKARARECLKEFMVNDCIGEARKLRHDQLSGIDAVQVEANRFKRRDKAEHIEAERARHEADRAANVKADGDLRTRNRKSFDDRSEQAKRDAAERARSATARAGRPSAARSPLVKVPNPGSPDANAAQRAKNADEQAAKVRDAAAHRVELARRHAQKEGDRARRVEQQAKKEAERKAAEQGAQQLTQRAAGAAPAPKP